MKKNTGFLAAAVILICLVLGMYGCARREKQAAVPAEAGTVSETENTDYRYLTRNGKKYAYNSRIMTVLYAGIDSEKELVSYNRYSIAPRADAVELIVMDDYHKKVSVLSISRDTITPVKRYTMNGSYRDTYDTQLGYAYTYGDGGKASCENLREAVSEFLHGIPVHEYVVTNNGSVALLNRLAGGITVTVPNDDLAGKFPELKKGAAVTLNDSNVEAFVRWRDTEIAFSNNGRMERQQAFSAQFLEVFMKQLAADKETVWNTIESMQSFIQTSITKNQHLELTDRILAETFTEDQYFRIQGTDVRGNVHDEFYADEESLLDTIIELFYIEDGEA